MPIWHNGGRHRVGTRASVRTGSVSLVNVITSTCVARANPPAAGGACAATA